MDEKRFNRNYKYNSKYNMPKICKTVKGFMEEPVNPQLFDFLFRYNARNYPKTTHEELELPGEFKQIEDTAVFVIGNGVLQMDYAESITPCGIVERDAANDVEHQTGKLNPDKVKIIFEYCLYTEIQLKKPCYPIVVTNHDYGKEYEDYTVEGFSFRIYFRIFNKEVIYKSLNTLMEKDYNQEVLSDADYLNLVYCIIFAKKPFAQDVIEKASYLFASIENIKFNHQLDLHMALKMAIKYYFDDEKIEELLTVITKAVDASRMDKFGGYEVEQFTIQELEDKISVLKAEKSKHELELSSKEKELSSKEKELSFKEKELSSKEKELSSKETELSQMDARIKQLEGILQEHGISF